MLVVLAILGSDPEGYPHILAIDTDKEKIKVLLDKKMYDEEYWTNMELVELEVELPTPEVVKPKGRRLGY